jgi:putative PIN family toxin of toxin-antitoxin system
VLDAVATGTLEPVMSWELAEEIADVLTRPKLARYDISPDALQTILMFLTRTLPSVAIDVPVRDPDDAPVVSAALAGNAEAIVTGDHDLLADEALVAWLGERGVSVYSPVEALDGALRPPSSLRGRPAGREGGRPGENVSRPAESSG